MSDSNLFALGPLLLTANLSLCALFAPSRTGSGSADRLVQLWKLLFLAMLEVWAWAIVLHQGGAAATLMETFTRCAACFALAGGQDGGFAPPWGELKPFIALNGLLFIPVALIPWMSAGTAGKQQEGALEEPFQIPADPHLPYPQSFRETAESAFDGGGTIKGEVAGTGAAATESPIRHEKPPAISYRTPEPDAPSHQSLAAVQPPPLPPSPPASDGQENVPGPAPKPFGFRPTIPKVGSRREGDSPEAQLAEQLKPVGPTPPPIRFR